MRTLANRSELQALRFVVFFALLTLPFCLCVAAPPPPPSPMLLERILRDQTIWGKDFFALLTFLSSWKAIGEETVVVFPEQVVGAKRNESRDEAAARAQRLGAAMQRPQPAPASRFEDLLRPFRDAASAFTPAGVPFLEDDSFRVVWSRPGAQFLKRDITIKSLQERFGPPQSVTTLLIQNEKERRPVVLTLYTYAEGAIVFAESDWAPVPGVVDRVLIDVRKVTGILFQE